MNGKLTGLLVCATFVGFAGLGAGTTAAAVPQEKVVIEDGTQPVPPPIIPPHAIAMFEDGTQPVPPPIIPPHVFAMNWEDGTQPPVPPTRPHRQRR